MGKLSKAQRDFLEGVGYGRPLRHADRAEDRVRQWCRRNGLAEVVRNPRRWVLTEAGRAALKDQSQPAGGEG